MARKRSKKRKRRKKYNGKGRKRGKWMSAQTGRSYATWGESHRRLKINIGSALLPPRTLITFKTCSHAILAADASAGTTEDTVLVDMGNLHTPFPGTTNQAAGFDEWFGFFNKGRCLSASLKLTAIFSVVSQNTVFGIVPEAGAGGSAIPTAFADTVPWTEWCEYPRAQYRTRVIQSATNNNKNILTMRYNCKPHKFFNESLKGNDNFDFASGSGPINRVGIHVIISNVLAGSALTDSATYVTLKFELVQRCIFYDRKNIVPSVV